MPFRVQYKRYRRRFCKPLRTARGEWKVREGFLLKMDDAESGRVCFSEVAPIPEFGTETIEEAGKFLEARVVDSNITCSNTLPCCQFALSIPLLETTSRSFEMADISALLPAGQIALDCLTAKQAIGHRNFKWKIGAFPLEDELRIARQLLEQLTEGQQLRFDANGSLSVDAFKRWLEVLRKNRDQVDYLEQPLSVGEEATMQSLGEAAGINIALDESLNGPSGQQFLKKGEWLGIYVLKPLLAGDIAQLRDKLGDKGDRVVYSSVFETDIGVSNTVALIAQSHHNIRPLGFDTRHAFDDTLVKKDSSSIATLTLEEKETIWSSI